MTVSSTLRLATALVLLGAPACGGSSSTPAPTVPGATTLDALYPTSLASAGGLTGGDGPMYLGEYWSNSDTESRIAFVFDLTSLPASSVVTAATLEVYVTAVEGGGSSFHPEHVDHEGRSSVSSPQGGLPGDFGGTFDDMDVAQVNALTINPGMPSSWTVDVTSEVASAWAGGADASVFRMRPTGAPLVNGGIDAYHVGGTWSGDAQTWNPVLHVEYLAP